MSITQLHKDLDASMANTLTCFDATGRLLVPDEIKEFDGTQATIMYALIGDELVTRQQGIGRIYASPEQDTFARVMVEELNRQRRAHGGYWRCGLTGAVKSKWDNFSRIFRPHMPTIFRFLWHYHDGALGFAVTVDDELETILNLNKGGSFPHYLECCEEGYEEFIAVKNYLGVTEEERVTGVLKL
jgi:hypothetical protein